ncbi:MAG: cytochrome b/b6 domain-containing protein [Pseudomonadales bacterium]|jgi:cytochrome b|nr:cytochrome b/b6 domain-containing protein [Pseudomonadales bacterium]
MNEKPYRVWDLPLRLFHWSLVILVAISIYTGENGGFNEMDYHMLSGYAILALVLFRVIWGFVGSEHARFSDFVRPSAIVAYSRSLLSKDIQEDKRPGHNPLGALSVLAFLVVLLVQAGTGLFANDDIFLEGPLTHLVEDEMSDDLTTVHHFAAKVLYVLVFLHLAAILFYQFVRKEPLLLAMITGRFKGRTGKSDGANLLKETAMAVVTLAVCSGFVYYLINEV